MRNSVRNQSAVRQSPVLAYPAPAAAPTPFPVTEKSRQVLPTKLAAIHADDAPPRFPFSPVANIGRHVNATSSMPLWWLEGQAFLQTRYVDELMMQSRLRMSNLSSHGSAFGALATRTIRIDEPVVPRAASELADFQKRTDIRQRSKKPRLASTATTALQPFQFALTKGVPLTFDRTQRRAITCLLAALLVAKLRVRTVRRHALGLLQLCASS